MASAVWPVNHLQLNLYKLQKSAADLALKYHDDDSAAGI